MKISTKFAAGIGLAALHWFFITTTILYSNEGNRSLIFPSIPYGHRILEFILVYVFSAVMVVPFFGMFYSLAQSEWRKPMRTMVFLISTFAYVSLIVYLESTILIVDR
jgi:hypothetical protein